MLKFKKKVGKNLQNRYLSVSKKLSKPSTSKTKQTSDKRGKRKFVKGWIPFKLTIEDLNQILSTYNKDFCSNTWHWETDYAIALTSLILIRYYRQDKEKENPDGWVEIPGKELKKWVHSHDYKKYVDALKEAEVIEVDPTHISRSLAEKLGVPPQSFQYRINPELQTGKFKNKPIPYTLNRMIAKFDRHSLKAKQRRKRIETRMYLIDEAKRMFNSIDLDVAYYELSQMEPEQMKMPIDELWFKLNTLLDGSHEFYFNTRDSFGGRLHTPFTNLPSIVRKWIRIPDVHLCEIDIKNSQLFFFASTAVNSFDSVYELLMDDNNPEYNQELAHCIRRIQFYYNSFQTVRKFCQQCLKGNCYEWLAEELNTNHITDENGRSFTRNDVKKRLIFPALYSNQFGGKKEKEILSKVIPEVVELCESLNRKHKYSDGKAVPRLMQQMESRIMIDRIAVDLYGSGTREFITIHDSIIFNKKYYDVVEKLFNKSFTYNELQVPIYNISNLF